MKNLEKTVGFITVLARTKNDDITLDIKVSGI